MDTKFKDQVNALMRSGKTSDALAILLESSKENKKMHESINMVLAEFNVFNTQRIRGTIPDEEIVLKFNKINDKILIALDSFNDDGVILPSAKNNKVGKSTKILLKLGLSMLMIGLGLLLGGYLFESKLSENSIAVILLVVGMFIVQGGLIVLACWLIAFLWQAVKGN